MFNEFKHDEDFTIQDAYELLSKKLENYLNLSEENAPKQGFYKTADKVFDKHGIQVYIRCEKDSKHKLPHIHIKNGSGQEISIELNIDAKILEGGCDSKTYKKIKIFVNCNLEILQKMWNTIYNGESIKPLKYQIQDIK